MQNSVLQLDARDNVLIALTDLKTNDQVRFSGHKYALLTDVPAKHKFATRDLSPGDPVVMYGVLVGKAVAPIRCGEIISTRNIHHETAAFHEEREPYHWHAPDVSRWLHRTFLGYRRPDGQVGTRNYWLVLPSLAFEAGSGRVSRSN